MAGHVLAVQPYFLLDQDLLEGLKFERSPLVARIRSYYPHFLKLCTLMLGYISRDIINWAMIHGYKRFRSSGLNYDPKLHLGHRLDPIDLYVRHVSPLANWVMGLVLPWIVPARYDTALRKFPDYRQLW